jgi:hypothetical protein
MAGALLLLTDAEGVLEPALNSTGIALLPPALLPTLGPQPRLRAHSLSGGSSAAIGAGSLHQHAAAAADLSTRDPAAGAIDVMDRALADVRVKSRRRDRARSPYPGSDKNDTRSSGEESCDSRGSSWEQPSNRIPLSDFDVDWELLQQPLAAASSVGDATAASADPFSSILERVSPASLACAAPGLLSQLALSCPFRPTCLRAFQHRLPWRNHIRSEHAGQLLVCPEAAVCGGRTFRYVRQWEKHVTACRLAGQAARVQAELLVGDGFCAPDSASHCIASLIPADSHTVADSEASVVANSDATLLPQQLLHEGTGRSRSRSRGWSLAAPTTLGGPGATSTHALLPGADASSSNGDLACRLSTSHLRAVPGDDSLSDFLQAALGLPPYDVAAFPSDHQITRL